MSRSAGLLAVAASLLLAAASASPAGATYKFVTKWGSPGRQAGEFFAPSGIAVDRTGTVYVADVEVNRIQRFTSTGALLGEWPADVPWGVASDGSNLFVALHAHNVMRKFEASGAVAGDWGGFGPLPGQFDRPRGVATDDLGNVYVADFGNRRVQEFSNGANLIRSWGTPELLRGPEGVAVDHDGNVYVSDIDETVSSTGRTAWINKFDNSGQLLARWPIHGFPALITVFADRLYAPEIDRILVYDLRGNVLNAFGSRGSADGQFNRPFGVAVDGSGNVYVTDQVNQRVQKFAPVEPDTKIDAGPSGAVSDATPTFTFSSTPNTTFECRFDTAAFGPCSGPGSSHTPPAALADGFHKFEVRARDSEGTDQSAATRDIVVDTIPPRIMVLVVTPQLRATWAVSEPARLTITIQRAPERHTIRRITRTVPAGKGTVSLRKLVGRLPRGAYRVTGRATDAAGNRSMTVVRHFKVR